MLICILGSGYVSRKAAEDLIEDYISAHNDPVTIMMPSYATTDGMRNVKEAVANSTVSRVEKYKRTELVDVFLTQPLIHEDDSNARRVLMVLDPYTEPEIVDRCLDARVEVADLTRGLFFSEAMWKARDTEVTSEHPLYGSESQSETLSGSPSYDGLGKDSETSDSLSELYMKEDIIRADWLKYFDSCSLEQLKGIEEELRNAIYVREQANPVPYENGLKVREDTGPEPISTLGDAGEKNTIKYWKSKTGRLRKAGRSKPKPGETEVFLTEDYNAD